MNWMDLQINYLLALQNFRDVTGGIFDAFFLNISTFGTTDIAFVVLFGIYWCINKKIGTYMIHCYVLSYLMNIFIKMSACIYRPWILDNRIHPVESAIKGAPGYSFPSGHTAGVTSCFGSLAVSFWQNKIIRYFCFFIIFMVMLSRNYLGVHTPQDVIVSLFVGILIILGTKRLFDKIEKDKKHYYYFIVTITLVCIALGLYIIFKQYPLDYTRDGLLYNPYSIQSSTVARIFNLWGIMFGCFLEANFVKFNPKSGSIIEKIIRLAVGIFIFHIIESRGTWFFAQFMDYACAKTTCLFMGGFFATFLYPCAIKLSEFILAKAKNRIS